MDVTARYSVADSEQLERSGGMPYERLLAPLDECTIVDCAEVPRQRLEFEIAERPSTQIYTIRRPDIARLMTSCWICSVPSKMSWISRFEGKIPAQGTSVDHKTRVFGPETHIYSPICKQFLVLRKGSIDS